MKLPFRHTVVAFVMLLVFIATSILSATYAISIEPEDTKYAQLTQKAAISGTSLLAIAFEEKDVSEDDLEQFTKKARNFTASHFFLFHFFKLWDEATSHLPANTTRFHLYDAPTFILNKVFRL